MSEIIRAIIEGGFGLAIAWLAYRTNRTVQTAHREHKNHEEMTRQILASLNGEAEK